MGHKKTSSTPAMEKMQENCTVPGGVGFWGDSSEEGCRSPEKGRAYRVGKQKK